MKILFLADVVGEPGRNILKSKLSGFMAAENPDFVIANGENSAGGKGLVPQTANDLFSLGVNVITLGNHAFDKKEVSGIIEDNRVLRPANYPTTVPGAGWNIYQSRTGNKIAVVSLQGRVYLPLTDCPFRKADEILKKVEPETKIIFVDFHAEITSEKQMMGWYLDGKVSAVIGTHTHIPTADERIMPNGTAYITDSGMCGPRDGVIGMDKEVVLQRYLTGLHKHYVMSKGPCVMQGCVLEINDISGKAESIKRFSIDE